MINTNVLIVGAGPAGSVCASLLQKAGVDCLLIDHATFPRDKICGGGLTPKAWKLLDRLIPGIEYEFIKVNHIKLLINARKGCEFYSDSELRIVRRRDFDAVLLQHYRNSGGAFLKDAFLKAEEKEDSIEVELKSGETVKCQYLIGADGSNSHVRRHLTGKSDRGILAMEQYMERSDGDDNDDVIVNLTRQYDKGGYFYKFPNISHNVVGYGDNSTTPERFRQVMTDMKIPVGKARGAYIFNNNDYPLHDRIILIGDAGGFANRLTCEGLFDAFQTAQNAATAVVNGVPFSATNKKVFKKMKKETVFAHLFFSAPGFVVLRLMCHFPKLIKRCFDIKMNRESFFRK